MASSKLLKEAIADAKAVRETAIANAKIALEEAFTPRLQSILSRKLTAEMEGDDEEADMNEENDTSSEIGGGDNKEPADKAYSAQTDLSGIEKQSAEAGDELEDYEEVDDLMEGEESPEDETEDANEYAMEGDEMAPEADEDELDLESIIRELEDEMGAGDAAEDEMEMESEEGEYEDPTNADDATLGEEGEDHMEPDADNMGGPSDYDADNEDDTIDLDEILREMGYGDDEENMEEEANDEDEKAAMQAELKEAYDAIKSLRKTINEVNLLNAKLLYTNKLFRNYNLTNEQKIKVVENLDRTSNVREVKLVYATLSESMKFTGTERKVAAKKSITEGLASKPSASTAPKKQIISESTNDLSRRFQELAGIVKK